ADGVAVERVLDLRSQCSWAECVQLAVEYLARPVATWRDGRVGAWDATQVTRPQLGRWDVGTPWSHWPGDPSRGKPLNLWRVLVDPPNDSEAEGRLDVPTAHWGVREFVWVG